MVKYYAVVIGRIPGIYTSWDDAKDQIHKYPNALYKSFNTKRQAEEFISNSTAQTTPFIIYENPLPDKTIIYTDGSYQNGISSYGIIIIMSDGDIYTAYGKVPEEYGSSNNVGELYAIYMALELTKNYDNLILYTDSDYAIGNLTTRIHDWVKNGWKGASNKELTQDTYDAINNRKIDFYYTKGHKGIKYNEEADKLADLGNLCDCDLMLYLNGELVNY